MNQMENFKMIIVEERRRAGLTQEALATRLGITPQAVSKWENGVGYPDVTLFPVIADVLGIPISRLFGEGSSPKRKTAECPTAYMGMVFVCSEHGHVCYADAGKAVEKVDTAGGILYFADGSEAHLNTATVTNRGDGEARVFRVEDIVPEIAWEESRETTLDRELPLAREFMLSVSRSCDIKILAVEDGVEGKCRVMANGEPSFIAALEIRCEGDRMTVEVKMPRSGGSDSRGVNKLKLYVGAEHARLLKITTNGSGSVDIAPDFDRVELSINGCGDIKANGAGEAVFQINGSGYIELGEAVVSAKMGINGSGDITVHHTASPKMLINGSGDIRCGDVHGEISATVNGSGDITCDGSAARLTLSVNGSGDFHGEKLTVTDAEISAHKSTASITIGQIRGTSIERLSKNCTLKVGKRGK